MPLGNIKELELSREERERVHFLQNLKYPRDKKLIFHLSPCDVKDWLYLLDPKEALILMSTSDTKLRINKQLTWKRWTFLTDFFWRILN